MTRAPDERPDEDGSQDIAVIGMAGRFPGAGDVEAFWANLLGGVESIREVPGDGPPEPGWVRAAAVLDGMDRFDAAFFGVTPREAELMDPQHRVFLEVCWEALEHAGHGDGASRGAVGVFGGAATNTYLPYNLLARPDVLGPLDFVQIDVGNGADFLAVRVSYKLNLRGPSYTVASACSTSLVAVHVACRSLLDGECDLALAGGVSIHVKHPEGYRYVPGGIVSPDGRCRAFGARAAGTVFGSGAGVVVLRRLDDAIAAGDTIHAVIRGSAVNNDGARKVGFTAPGVDGQAAVIREALAAADVPPESIGYVETHGTGTQMGDPIEARALAKALKPKSGMARRPIPIGSVKTNIGHLANAAGAASLIKAVLALREGRLPPSLHAEEPHPEIDWTGSGLYVNREAAAWARGAWPRRAGVSSFGVGGTNAHVVLEEAPPPIARAGRGGAQLLVVSAKTEAALDEATRRLARHLGAHPEQALADVAFTLQVGRQAMRLRRAVVCADRAEAIARLADPAGVPSGAPATEERPAAFVLPDAGAGPWGSARALYDEEPAFRAAVDACVEAARGRDGIDSIAALLAASPAPSPMARFVRQYALAKTWIAWGVAPAAIVGQGVGEVAAACLAGRRTLAEAVALVEGARPSGSLAEALSGVRASSPQVIALEIGGGEAGDRASLLAALGRLWLDGARIDWRAHHARAPGRRVPLPTYPFARDRFWIEPRPPAENQAAAAVVTEAAPVRRELHPRPPLATPYVAPRTEMERALAALWQEVLGLQPVGIDDNFFELGGSSLIATQAAGALAQTLGAEVPAAALYQHPTVRMLATLAPSPEGDPAAKERADRLARRREELARRNQELHNRRR